MHASLYHTFSSASLDLNLRNSVVLDGIRRVISVTTKVCVVSIFDLEKISSLLNMVGTTVESIHLLERDFLGLGNEKPDEDSEEEVNAGKEVEGITRVGC
jgi:hypothetical protein